MTRAAVDIGGTFTDLVYLDDGEIGLGKTSTTPRRFEEGVVTTLEEAALGEVEYLAHGTTIVINALTERTGSRTALITTRGFRDVLEIARANRPDLYNLQFAKPPPFVPRRLRFEVTERVTYKGEVLTALSEDDVRAAVAAARSQGAEAIAICLLHSYANPEHERRVAEIVRAEWPDVAVTASHELTNEWREYERTSTAVLDAYVKPTARRYLDALASRLDELGVGEGARFAMQSNGGVSRFAVAGRTPINLVESGPVGGVIGAAAIGRAIDEPNLISLDIGGTTAKSSLVERGTVPLTGDYYIEKTPQTAGYPIKIPVVDIIEIGAGGGSIAWLDPAGALHVGPRSAGADPGPASYGRGGSDPTVTDANVLVERINPSYFLGGRVALDVERARAAFEPLAERIGVGVEDAALGVIRLANANMLHLLKLVSVRRGRDPREFAIVACGGGGPMHATALARELQVPRVIVPPHPAHFSAWGMLVSDLRHDFVRTRFTRFDEVNLGTAWAELERSALALFADERVAREDVTFVRTADMRYAGQEHAVNVPVAEEREETAARFHELHEQLYAFRLDSPIEIVNFRLTAYGAVQHPAPRELAVGSDVDAALKGARQVHYDELGAVEARIYERERLGAGARVAGPAVIEEPASNTVVFPDQAVRVDRWGNLIVERSRG